jgi:hypothetical protein
MIDRLLHGTGHSLLELIVGLGFIVTVGALVSPPFLESVDAVRAEGAARYLSAKLHRMRMEAIVRSASVGLQFVAVPQGYVFAAHVDGNGNGIRTVDIQNGVDQPISDWERLPDRFADVDFGLLSGLPPVESDAAPPGTDPIKLGSGSILTFTPLGTSSSGSLYLLGRRGAQYVIRVLGETGRTRVLRFDLRARQWRPA